MFFGFFAFSNLEEGTWISVVSWRTQLCALPLCRKKIDVRLFERLENLEEGTWSLVVSWRTAFCNKLAASARILFVKCIFGRFLFFCVFKPEEGTWIWRHFSTPAEPSWGKASRLKSSWAESSGTDRPALYTLTPDRPPLAACTGNSFNMFINTSFFYFHTCTKEMIFIFIVFIFKLIRVIPYTNILATEIHK